MALNCMFILSFLKLCQALKRHKIPAPLHRETEAPLRCEPLTLVDCCVLIKNKRANSTTLEKHEQRAKARRPTAPPTMARRPRRPPRTPSDRRDDDVPTLQANATEQCSDQPNDRTGSKTGDNSRPIKLFPAN